MIIRNLVSALPTCDILLSVVASKNYTSMYISEVPVPHCIAGVTIMLSITIFATIVGEMLPVSDATPLIGLQTVERSDCFFCTF